MKVYIVERIVVHEDWEIEEIFLSEDEASKYVEEKTPYLGETGEDERLVITAYTVNTETGGSND